MSGKPVRRAAAVWLCLCLSVHAADWLTFAHDPQRSGWASREKDLSPETVAGLELKWKSKVKNEPKALTALTAPLVAADVFTAQGVKTLVFVAGSSNNLHALDAATGQVVWSREFESWAVPAKKDQWLCPQGIGATPVIDKRAGLIYLIAADGRLVGCDLGSGKTRFGPIQFVPPFSKSWSLNLHEGVIYTSLSQGCGNAQSGLYAMDVRDPMRPATRHLLVSTRGSNGIWGRGGPVLGEGGRVFATTGDGPWDPAAGLYGSSVIAATSGDLRLVDYYTPLNWRQINLYDWDMGCTSPVFFARGSHRLLTFGAKEGVIYLMDADALGDKDHQTPLYVTPRLGNDEDTFEGRGIWGSVSAWRDETTNESWVYYPMWGPVSKQAPKFPLSYGEAPHGSIMAFKVGDDPATRRPVLRPGWISADFNVPDPPVIANGVVFALSTGENVQQTVQGGVIFKNKLTLLTDAQREGKTQRAVLYALDARTGKTLYQSGTAIDTWTHFSGLAVADGRVYAVDYSSQVYSFGLKDKQAKQ